MGAWDASSFGNDTANDWAYSLERCSDFSCIEKALWRVLDAGDAYETMPAEVGGIIATKELYFVEFSISAAAKDGDVKYLGNFPIPAWAVDWPTMRAPQIRLDGKKPEWWAILHAGELIASDAPEERRIKRLTREQRKLSIARWWTVPRLVERLVEGWRPEHEY